MKAPNQYTHDVDGSYSLGRFRNETSLGAGDGTNTEAALFDDVYYALINVILASGIDWDGDTLETQGGVTDFLNAITAYARTANGNPYMNYAEFTEQQTTGVNGGNTTTGWNDRILNTTAVNNITGASLDAGTGVITLPAGTYEVRASQAIVQATGNVGGAQSAIRKASDNSVIKYGMCTTDGPGYGTPNPAFERTFTLAEETAIKYSVYVTLGLTNGKGYAVSSGGPEIYALFGIRKLD